MGGKKRQAREQKEADEKEKLETLAQGAGALSDYRPHMQQGLNNVLQQQLSAFQGTNNLLDQMGLTGFGDGSQYGNVVGQDMMEVGQTSQATGWDEDAALAKEVQGKLASGEMKKPTSLPPHLRDSARRDAEEPASTKTPPSKVARPRSRDRRHQKRPVSGITGSTDPKRQKR